MNLHEVIKFLKLSYIYKVDIPEDSLKIAELIFSVISSPEVAEEFRIDDLKILFEEYISKKKAGWCYENAMFMHLILNEYNRPSYVYNYGIEKTRLTHAIVIVNINGIEYPMDPYFCKCYVNDNNEFMSFDDIINHIENKNCDKIKSLYGNGLKAVYMNGSYKMLNGENFEKKVYEDWINNFDYNNMMMKIFNSTNPLNLMKYKLNRARIVKKIFGEPYYEFF